MKRSTINLGAALAFGLVCLAAAGAEAGFGGLDLGKDNDLLFTASAGIPGGGDYDTLFLADLGATGARQLTVYPEHVSLIEGGRILQVQNRFGLFRSDAALDSLEPVKGYPAFVRGSPILQGRLPECAASPDGAYVLSMVPSSAAYARLVLFDVAKGTETTVSTRVERSVESFPARWSPDSRNFVYAKGGSIYYFSIRQYTEGQVFDEEFRRIGDGRIQCARWASDGSLFYLRGRSLFRILPAEFFVQALYRGAAGMGVLAGKTPFSFDPNFDDFWVAPEGSRVLLSKGGRNLFLVYLNPDDFGSPARVAALPYLYLQGDTTVLDVLWPPKGPVTIFTGSLRDGVQDSGAFRFAAPISSDLLSLNSKVTEVDAKDATEMRLSPDGSKVAIVTPAGVEVRSYADWSSLETIAAPGCLHALWLSEDRMVTAGSRRIETVRLSTGARGLVALSQVEAYGRADDGAIVVKTDQGAYAPPPSDKGAAASATPVWAARPTFAVGRASASSDSYRVYLGDLAAAPYRNLVMVRSVAALGTRELFPLPERVYAPFPPRDEPRTPGIFDHGSRIRSRELALVFDAVDSTEGLTQVLRSLKDDGIRATFFVNGEFIKESPGAARLLAASGNEVGSMFFTDADPSDARFRIDRDYVRRGLARTEDEWFSATGKELSLLWHMPYYTTNSEIVAAGESMSYTYVGRDIDPLDWIGKTDAASLPGSYLSAHDIIERVVAQAKPGSIIPVRLGIPDGGRGDYLFREIPLLIDALEDEGYAIVPVSTLIAHAK